MLVLGLALSHHHHRHLHHVYCIYISVIDEASDFKFGMQLEFAKAHHKITRRSKGVYGPGLGELLKIWVFPSVFSQWLKQATSNSVHCLGLPRPIIKSHTEEKSGRGPVL